MPDGYGYETSRRVDKELDQGMSEAKKYRIQLIQMSPEERARHDEEQKQLHKESDERIKKYDAAQKEKYIKQQENQKKFCEFFNGRGDLVNLQDIQKDEGDKLRRLNREAEEKQKQIPRFALLGDARTNKTKLENELKDIQTQIMIEKENPKKLKDAFDAWTKQSGKEPFNYDELYMSDYQQNYRLFLSMLKESNADCKSTGGRRKSRKQKSKKYRKPKKSRRNKK